MASETTTNMTPEEIKNLMHTPDQTTVFEEPIPNRRFLVIGVGDGGCNIANTIKQKSPKSVYFMAYNTSARALDKLDTDLKVIPFKEDGSGKDRTKSQEIFRKGSYKKILESVAAIQSSPDIACDYILVTTTAGGGTGGGTSPMLAKFLRDNVDTPVMVLGVYPNRNEDATAQYNALMWQSEIEEAGLNYIVLDNDGNLPQLQYHDIVNRQAAAVIELLTGECFGETNLSQIDNQDMYTLLTRFPGRITVHSTTSKPSVGVSIGEHLRATFGNWNEPAPSAASGYGLFIKAPANVLENADTDISEIKGLIGQVPIQYTHLEESDSTLIALVCVGCASPSDRLTIMRDRYNDIQDVMKDVPEAPTKSLANGLLNPLNGKRNTGAPIPKGGEMDLSALGL